MSESELLARAQSGDRAALEALLTLHQAKLYRFSLKMCRDEQDARDVVQETLVAMARGVRDFRGQSSLATWLFTIARSFCSKQRRTSKYAPTEMLSVDSASSHDRAIAGAVLDPSDTPDEALVHRRIEQALESAIRALDPMYREVLILRDVEGLSAQEVSQIVQLSVGAVKSRLHRARLAVRERIAPLLDIEPSTSSQPAAVLAPNFSKQLQQLNGGCPDVLLLFSQHLEGEISAEVCTQMQGHLQECERCSASCASLRETLRLCKPSEGDQSVAPNVQASVRQAIAQLSQQDPALR
jgi:RNA polymerase sigma-70 factor (ECF subfamily)